MQAEDAIPPWLGNLAALAFLLALVGTTILLAVLLLGAADPKPLGPLFITDELDDADNWTVWPEGGNVQTDNGAYIVSVPEPQSRFYAAAPYDVETPVTLEVSVRQMNGPGTAGYGVWWGNGPQGPHTGFLVNGDGYLAVFGSDGRSEQVYLPWQLFPWVGPQGNINRLRVDIQGREALLRANDEIVGAFDWSGEEPFRTGFVVETGTQGGAQIAFEQLVVWKDH